jgi:hypothetical protein
MGRALLVVAAALFVVCFILVLVGGVDKKVLDELTFAGLACFAGGHAL